MLYRELLPSPGLREQIKCIWILEHRPGPDPEPEKILPDGRVELIFNLGAPYRQLGEAPVPLQPRSFVVGQIRRCLQIVPTGTVRMLGVRLEPVALHRLLALPMKALTDQSVALSELGVAELIDLEEQLHTARDWSQRIRLTNRVLGRLLTPGRNLICDATQLIRRTHGQLDLATVAREVGASTRTLDRRFAAEVGLTPKLFSRQVRLQRVFDLLSRSPRPSWSEIAQASGCFDQAHLNREFRTFAGESPAAYLSSQHELSNHLTGLGPAGS